MPKVTLDQKRLDAIRRQLYGKPQAEKIVKRLPESRNLVLETRPMDGMKQAFVSETVAPSQNTLTLKKDLTKILILSTLALSLQVLLYLSLKNNLLSLPFIR
ncbi:hypothetical protein HYS97_00550 [Candidatus Daviesbacteria bacterium]|nr:hypothetical protein [Candidatus Daviesbacteria bacterium]